MNKADLVSAVADKAGLSKADADRAVAAFVEAVSGALKGGEKVTIVGFGTFSVSRREARQGRNPRTGQAVQIAARATPKFKASKGLDESLA